MPIVPAPLAQVVLALTPLPGYEDVVVGAAAVGLSPPQRADAAMVQVQAQPVRMRVDGQPPTASSGLAWVAGDIFLIAGRVGLFTAQFIREGAVDGVLSVHYMALTEQEEVRIP